MHRPVIMGVSLLIALVALGLAWRSWHVTRAWDSVSADAGSEILRLKKRLADLENTRVLEERMKTGGKLAVTSVKKPSLADLMAELTAETRQRTEAYRAELLAKPTLQTLYEQNERARHSALFAALFHRLKMSPEQRKSFVDTCVKHRMQQLDLDAIAKKKGLPRNDPQWEAARAAADAEMVSEIETLLGPGALAMTREYTRLETVRGHLASYAGLFSRLGEPLTIDQLEKMTAVFGAVTSTSPNTALYRFTSAHWEQIWADAPRILTPEQWRLFQTMTPLGQSSSRWESAVNEILTKTAGPGPQ